MAHRRVKATKKDSDGDILALCNSGSDWEKVTRAAAIKEIEDGKNTYYVHEDKHSSDVVVSKLNGKKYLRAKADGQLKNNLDNLPDC